MGTPSSQSKDDGQLRGKIALVTGASNGIGSAIAERFWREGACVIAVDCDPSAVEPGASQDGRHHRRRMDVGSEADWTSTMDWVQATLGGLDILVNNAGIHRTADLLETSLCLYEEVVRTNQIGTFLGMREAARVMTQHGGGSIVNLSSTAGLGGLKGMTAYVASKYAIRGMTKVAALELADRGIRVNSVHPGLIDTPMTRALGREWQSAGAARTPLGRRGSSEEVASLVLFLASEASSFCTGSEYVCDGGITAGPRM